MRRLLQALKGENVAFLIAFARHVGDEDAGIVVDGDTAQGYLAIAQQTSLGNEVFTQLCRVDVVDLCVDAETDLPGGVAHTRDADVGKGEQRSALADACRIEVLGRNGHLCPAVSGLDVGDEDVGMGGELVARIEGLEKGHRGWIGGDMELSRTVDRGSESSVFLL